MKPGALRPFFPYYGSKWNIARHYPAPARGLVIEPFAGAAGYATYWGAENVMLVDRDPIIAGLWKYLLAVTPDEIMALPELPEAGDSVDNYVLDPGARSLIGFWLNRGSASPKLSRTAYSARSDRGQLNWGPRAKERIAGQLERIEGWGVIEGDYQSIFDVDATWFIDPPYGDKGKYYRVRFNDFEALGAWSFNRTGQIIVCEGAGATWLPFEPLGDFKSSLGRAAEVAWIAERPALTLSAEIQSLATVAG